MSRIELASPMPSRELQDGQHLRKHILQQMEKQWLALWQEAPEADVEVQAPRLSTDSRHDAIGGGHNGDVSASLVSRAYASSQRPTPEANEERAERANAETQTLSVVAAHRSSAHGDKDAVDKSLAPTVSVPPPPGPGAVTAFAGLAAPPGPALLTGSDAHAASDRRAAVTAAPPWATPAKAAQMGTTLASRAASTALIPAITSAVVSAPPPSATTSVNTNPSGESVNPRDQAKPAPSESIRRPGKGLLEVPRFDNDAGPRRLMVRELAGDLIQATVRDAQLGQGASQLAALGLARALMDAGYARVKVTVNGRTAYDISTGPEAAPLVDCSPSSVSTSSSPLKESIHGY